MAVTTLYDKAFSDISTNGGPRVNVDYRTLLIKQRESAAPFLSFMLNVNSEPTQTHEFRNFETRPNPKQSASTGIVAVGSTAGATVTWNVTYGGYFAVGDIVRPSISLPADATQTNEGIVTAVSSNALTVAPNDKTLIICAITASDVIQVWGFSHMQGALGAKASGTIPKRNDFYTQIFKHAYSVTRTHANNRLYGAPERDRLRGEKEIEHLTEIEKSLIYSGGVLDTADTYPRTTLTGFIPQISTNKFYYGTNLDSDELFDAMTSVHAPKYATDGKMSRRLVIASAGILSDVNKIALKTKMTLDVATIFGMDVSITKWVNRTWTWIEDPILSTFLPGVALIMQPRYVKLREFLPTRLEANIQANDEDLYRDQFKTELGLEVQLEELHGFFWPGTAPA